MFRNFFKANKQVEKEEDVVFIDGKARINLDMMATNKTLPYEDLEFMIKGQMEKSDIIKNNEIADKKGDG